MNIKLFKSRARNYIYYKRKTKILDKKSIGKRILYIGVANNTNMGDLAQNFCIRRWIEENYPHYVVLEIPLRLIVDDRFGFMEKMKKEVRCDDTIIFQSGYCTHDIAPSQTDLMHRIIISNFPDNRILMLPQSVFFQNEDRKKLSSEIYSKAKRMFLASKG